MLNLRKAFDSLPLPSKADEEYFSAQPIIGYDNYRIAKNKLLQPSLLISTSKIKNDFLINNQELYNLKVRHNVICQIETQGIVSSSTFSIISYDGTDYDTKNIFLNFCETLLPSLGYTPSSRTIRQVVQKLIELFKTLSDIPKTTIQGLWSELLLINLSPVPHRMIDAWHSIPEEKFDFSYNNISLEVKSTSKQKREHYFSLEQLTPFGKATIIVASIITIRKTGGINTQTLLNRIEKKLGQYPMQREKLISLVGSTLGTSLNQIRDVEFDYNYALESLRFFDSCNIPSIASEDIPKEISNIKFTCNLENTTHLPSFSLF